MATIKTKDGTEIYKGRGIGEPVPVLGFSKG